MKATLAPPVSRSLTLTSGMPAALTFCTAGTMALMSTGVNMNASRLADSASSTSAVCCADVVGGGRDVVEHRETVRLRHLLGAGAHRARDRIAGALGEDRQRLGMRRRRAERHQDCA